MTTAAQGVQRPRVLFFGSGDVVEGQATVLRDDFGTLDGSAPFSVLLRSNAIVPARPSDEVLCYATYVTIGHQVNAATPIDIVLYVDDRELSHQIVVPQSADYRVSRWEIGWNDPDDTGRRVAGAPRGLRVQVGLRIPQLVCGCSTLDLDGVECEIEVRAESIYPSTAP